ncbi:MAG: P-loop NTPase [Candidatus Devosia phytovorans]|uniref:P-loop NTPase n=1 Tax=Candidatus Devosia phytovorans TaxID=3121372 RepID=A0AAJ5VSJ3_9HYPH|nr:P-loop NTPase [Devosia sp.]WEK03340.1 MAG: P-loop NTPase [Devosia sp.]
MISTKGKSTKRLFIIVGMKGGTGKSTTAVLLAFILRSLGFEVAVYDGDAAVSTTYLTLREALVPEEDQSPVHGAVRYDMRNPDEANTLLLSLDAGTNAVIHDLPGGTIGDIDELFRTDFSDGLSEITGFAGSLGYEIVVVHLITPDRANPASMQGFMNGFGAEAKYVAVLNRGLLRKGETFDTWLNSTERTDFLDLNGTEIEMPAIPGPLHKFGLAGLINPDSLDRYQQHLQNLFVRELNKQLGLILEMLE